jgi:hypothetical protein
MNSSLQHLGTIKGLLLLEQEDIAGYGNTTDRLAVSAFS